MKTAGLVLDIGNTSYRAALYADGNIFERRDGSVVSKELEQIKELAKPLYTLCRKVFPNQMLAHYRDTAVVHSIAVASVASNEFSEFFIKLLRKSFPKTPLRVISIV